MVKISCLPWGAGLAVLVWPFLALGFDAPIDSIGLAGLVGAEGIRSEVISSHYFTRVGGGCSGDRSSVKWEFRRQNANPARCLNVAWDRFPVGPGGDFTAQVRGTRPELTCETINRNNCRCSFPAGGGSGLANVRVVDASWTPFALLCVGEVVWSSEFATGVFEVANAFELGLAATIAIFLGIAGFFLFRRWIRRGVRNA